MSQPNVIPLHHDIVTRFLNMTEADDTPYLYRKWSAISLVAGALERRVWVNVGRQGGQERKTFPNLYIFLVGDPGIGKYIVNTVREIWRNTSELGSNKKAFFVADNNMTKASMIDRLAEAIKTYLPREGPVYEYNSLLVAAEEFGVFLPSFDSNFIAVLNEIYNAPEFYSETRRHGPAKEVVVNNPILNIIGGMQPVWMNTIFPQASWGMGLFSRVIMIYGTSREPTDPFAEGMERKYERTLLLESIKKLTILFGQLGWTPDAQAMLKKWHLDGGPPAPTHSKLANYLRRRTQHVIKLSMVSYVSRNMQLGAIEKIDVDRAIEWLLEAENLMPDIFRAMIGQSDSDVIEELYQYMVSLFGMNKKKPIHEHSLFMFLLKRLPSEKIAKVLESMERSGMISRVGGTDTYVPRNRTEFAE